MELKDIMNRGLLREMVAGGYISRREHNDDPLLMIYNYTPQAVFGNVWNQATLQCRGLITWGEQVVARPFKKFFGYEQHFQVYGGIPQGHAQVLEKADGSLGILYRAPDGKLAVATRGSFHSEQAEWATRWLRNWGIANFDLDNYTYLFEIVFKQNRIVVDYGDFEGLILLDVLRLSDLTTDHAEFQRVSQAFVTVRNYGPVWDDIEKMYQHVDPQQEGFVIRYDNGHRIKVKGERYLELHKLVTGLSERRLWAMLKDNPADVNTMLAELPDEFHVWAADVVNRLQVQRALIISDVTKHYKQVKQFDTRKEQAAWISKHVPKEKRGLVFCMLDNKMDRFKETVWRMVEPQGHITPTMEQEDV